MADDSQRAKARATFGASFFSDSKPIAPAKNFATAQQKTANSRPIPTFKVGGVVKKAEVGMPRNRAMPYEKPSRPLTAAELKEASKGTPYEKPAKTAVPSPSIPDRIFRGESERGDDMIGKLQRKAAVPSPSIPDRLFRGESERGDDMIGKLQRKADGGIPDIRKPGLMQRAQADLAPTTGMPVQGIAGTGMRPYKKGGKVQTSSDTARKLGKEMGGFKNGGKPEKKNIGGILKAISPIAMAIGAAKGDKTLMSLGALGMGANALMKRKADASQARVNKYAGNLRGADSLEGPKVVDGKVVDTGETGIGYKKGGKAGCYAVGGAGKVRKGMAPIKRAMGGAAKVRKGMMTPQGKITPGSKPKKGIGC